MTSFMEFMRSAVGQINKLVVKHFFLSSAEYLLCRRVREAKNHYVSNKSVHGLLDGVQVCLCGNNEPADGLARSVGWSSFQFHRITSFARFTKSVLET